MRKKFCVYAFRTNLIHKKTEKVTYIHFGRKKNVKRKNNAKKIICWLTKISLDDGINLKRNKNEQNNRKL